MIFSWIFREKKNCFNFFFFLPFECIQIILQLQSSINYIYKQTKKKKIKKKKFLGIFLPRSISLEKAHNRIKKIMFNYVSIIKFIFHSHNRSEKSHSSWKKKILKIKNFFFFLHKAKWCWSREHKVKTLAIGLLPSIKYRILWKKKFCKKKIFIHLCAHTDIHDVAHKMT